MHAQNLALTRRQIVNCLHDALVLAALDKHIFRVVIVYGIGYFVYIGPGVYLHFALPVIEEVLDNCYQVGIGLRFRRQDIPFLPQPQIGVLHKVLGVLNVLSQ